MEERCGQWVGKKGAWEVGERGGELRRQRVDQ